MTKKKTESIIKGAGTERLSRAEEQAKFRQDYYLVYNSDYCICKCSASEHSMEDVLDICTEIVTDPEYSTKSVVVWLDGELIAAAKRGDQGEAVVVDLSGKYPGWERRLPACAAS